MIQGKLYTHISASTNLRYESQRLMAENNNAYGKICKKTEIKNNIIKNTYAAFLWYDILKEKEHINLEEQCYLVHQFILASTNSHCKFQILFMYHTLYIPTCIFVLYFSCFPFLLIDHNRKQVLLIKRFMLIFVKSQLSVR